MKAAQGSGRMLMALPQYADVALAMGVVGVIVVLVIPIPTAMLDLLLCCQLALSLAIIMGTLYCNEPLDFAGFPSLLLFVTLFRLALNVASSRLILLNADAGQVIQSFGDFVVGGNYVVGLAIFLVLVAIQFVVITKGAGRVAEVAARFTLDAMPGKQMAIDADLNAGLIDEGQARVRRQKIERESSFFGAMDGASKFVRGDAIAGLLITAINILVGLAIGVFQRDMEISEAMRRYALLTIGDGLVTQVPALLISTASGILVTRSASELSLGQDLGRQLFLKPRPILITAVFLWIFAFMPGMPTVPFAGLGGILFVVAYMMSAKGAEPGCAAGVSSDAAPPPIPNAQESVEHLLKQDVVELELGTSLICLADHGGQGNLLGRIAQVRKRLAGEMGIVVPPVRIRDNLQLRPHQYRLCIRGAEAMNGELQPSRLLAISPNSARGNMQGSPTTEPAFGLPAIWIENAQRGRAEAFGYTVVDASSVLATHLQETLRSHAAELLSRQDVQAMVDRIKETHPALVKDVIPGQVPLPIVHRVLQSLLRERVPVRDLLTVLETLGDNAGRQETVEGLTERVRLALAPAFVRSLSDAQGHLAAVALEPELESRMIKSLVKTEQGVALVVSPHQVPPLLKAIEEQYATASRRQKQAALVCSGSLRPHLRRFIERLLPKAPVLSYLEIPRGVQLEIVSQVHASALGVDNANLAERAGVESGRV